jgi:CheY-like chemotaxis protein/HPt (histidine-containing phosphotransfer) domain-containing protein/anti-sigma regulatory factor (Ser/Thr protein kinase)
MPDYLYGDDIRLRQVLPNICGNAMKFTPKGHILLKVSAIGQSLKFEIRDTGIGIRKEDLPQLFSAFSQADMARNRNIEGTGLGLSISKSFVEMMGGTITVDSEYGAGTVFTFTIPIVPGDKSRIKSDAPAARDFYAPGAKILVVDDNEFNLKVAQGLLGLSKIVPKTADSGREAIALVQKEPFDLVFMDHMMPEMDGVEATLHIRRLGGPYETLPIIALTANAVSGAKEMFLEHGFNGFISKPINQNDLTAALREWLPESRQRDGLAAPPPGANEDNPSGAPEPRDFQGALSQMGFGVEEALSYLTDMEDLYRELVSDLGKSLQKHCDTMSALLQDGNLAHFTITVHGLKSALAQVGAKELSEMAAGLEAVSKEGNAGLCLERFPVFRERLLALDARLSAVLEKFPE